ncbi:MAG: undecaprenyl-diphosphate phosphatase [Bacteroidales bacterium]
MSNFDAIILGLIQGLTEFLPVSSSGHLAIGKELLGLQTEMNLSFVVLVHAATALSIIIVFWKDIWTLLKGLFKFQFNKETRYISMILISMIPVGLVGVFFKDTVDSAFDSLILVGAMLIVTALVLFISQKISTKRNKKEEDLKEMGFKEAIIIGLAQSVAVLPGISRSGSTIGTGLLCGVKKASVAKFSFLMVLVPILGEAFLDLVGGEMPAATSGISISALVFGFLAAFISGYAACKWMIEIVKKAKLTYFAVYCLIAGLLSITLTIW